MKLFRGFLVSITLFLCVMFVCGCIPLIIGAAAGVGGYSWMNGAMEKDYYVSSKKLHSATLKGLKNMGVKISENKEDKHFAKIIAEFADGKSININIEGVTERSSKIKVRVGLMGNKIRSEMILNAVQKYL